MLEYDPLASHGQLDDPHNSSADTLIASGETTPLLPGKSRRVMSRDGILFLLRCVLATLAALFVVVNLYLHFTQCPLYPSSMNAVRRDWAQEVAQHEFTREEWQLEKQQHAIAEEEWKFWVEQHDRDIARRIRREDERQERIRKEWAQEAEQHKREREETEHRENARRENERDKWQREVTDHDRIVEERRKREEEERQRLNMFWGRVEARTCTSYGAREYTAQLMNLPITWEHRVEACRATTLEVHGISYLPKFCEDKGPGLVIGRWSVNQHEPDCAPYWSRYKDEGCTSPGSGKRRIGHYLEHFPIGGDWREFCATTPARFRGLEFLGAHECYQQGSDTYGQWELDDVSCH